MTLDIDRQKNIITKIISDVGDGFLITGGHFILDGDKPKNMNEGTIESFSLAVSLYRKLKDERQARLGILLNDIGQICGDTTCQVVDLKTFNKDSFGLPDEYIKVMVDNNVPLNELHIFWEKHMRNRGKKLFRKIKDTHSNQVFMKENDYYFRLSTGEEVIMLRGNSIDKYGTPACPLIMAAYTIEQEKTNINGVFNIYYVGVNNSQNIPNHLVIEKGAMLAKDLGCKLEVKNLYVTEDNLLRNYQTK